MALPFREIFYTIEKMCDSCYRGVEADVPAPGLIVVRQGNRVLAEVNVQEAIGRQGDGEWTALASVRDAVYCAKHALLNAGIVPVYEPLLEGPHG